ncbi:50S ribosomal protein L4 [Candidatus Similichlamydia epinepheli]|uniref:50S ribosomal protein L4 n=1 Tax=Candidatus Similichlamydia epinepheli TaxID=1903953 RepID=UPI000D3424ED|nr:50S ribosomal protein L4 [Candidatus Similichlamydia epinepheli]
MTQFVRRFSFPDASPAEVVDFSALIEADFSPSLSMLHRCFVCLRANKRQRSACTLTRCEVSHSGKKPHPQKGTGRARQGSLASPQYRGGGVVFGPRGIKTLVKVNRKEKRACLRQALLDRLSSGLCIVGLSLGLSLSKPKTSIVVRFLRDLKLPKGKVLFLFDRSETSVNESGWSTYSCFQKSSANIPDVRVLLFSNINLQDVLVAKTIVFSEAAFDSFSKTLGTEGISQ